MCELLALSFNQPVRLSFSFRGFKKRSEDNPHGWGLGFYPDESALIFKEPIKAKISKLASFLEDYEFLKSKTFIAHIRKSTRGDISFRNTHPFLRELFGRDFVFAHNGTIEKFDVLSTGFFTPIGETDSEHIFCHVLDFFYKNGEINWQMATFKKLHEELLEINKKGKMNLIFSDGNYLFCYRDNSGYEKGLSYVERKPPWKGVELLDEDWMVNSGKDKKENIYGYIVATKPLTDEDWIGFKSGELKVFKSGELIYSQ